MRRVEVVARRVVEKEVKAAARMAEEDPQGRRSMSSFALQSPG